MITISINRRKNSIKAVFFILLTTLITTSSNIYGQVDSISYHHTNKNLLKKVAIVNASIYGGSMIGLYSAWYKDYPQSNFHTFDDNEEWLQIDKIGHAYSSYTMGRFSIEMWRKAGLSRKKSIWIGGLTGTTYQTVIETLDGFSSEWGWSWGDMGSNVLGSGLLISQELLWNEQRIQFKTSFHEKNYDEPIINSRTQKLFGNNIAERSLKDYNGQTYWLSFNLSSFLPKSKLPKWLMIAVGTGAEGLLGARENIWTDKNTGITYDRTNIPRFRQWYLAPDIDLTKIPTKKKWLKTTFFVLNSLKFPTPSLEYSNGNIKWNWLHF